MYYLQNSDVDSCSSFEQYLIMQGQLRCTSVDTMTETSGTNQNTVTAIVGLAELSRQFYLIFLSMSMLALAAAFSTTSVTVSLVVSNSLKLR